MHEGKIRYPFFGYQPTFNKLISKPTVKISCIGSGSGKLNEILLEIAKTYTTNQQSKDAAGIQLAWLAISALQATEMLARCATKDSGAVYQIAVRDKGGFQILGNFTTITAFYQDDGAVLKFTGYNVTETVYFNSVLCCRRTFWTSDPRLSIWYGGQKGLWFIPPAFVTDFDIGLAVTHMRELPFSANGYAGFNFVNVGPDYAELKRSIIHSFCEGEFMVYFTPAHETFRWSDDWLKSLLGPSLKRVVGGRER